MLPGLNPRKPQKRTRGDQLHLLVVLGSGGHTAEMFTILRDLDTSTYGFRTYVVGNNDLLSPLRARDFETKLERQAAQDHKPYGNFTVLVVPRARQIHQSLLSSPLSALQCLKACLMILRERNEESSAVGGKAKGFSTCYPDIVLSNGPATGTIMIAAAFLLRFAGCKGTDTGLRTIYVESWARVKSLSLSGKLLCLTGICDRVLVQWELTKNGLLGLGMKPDYRGAFVS